ncbi:MAG: hypothetical protein ACI87E_001353 [Mariniblastus sp.]|jgi:hypothetical protein
MKKPNARMLILLLLLLVPSTGCQSLKLAMESSGSDNTAAVQLRSRLNVGNGRVSLCTCIELESNGNAACVDYFFQAAMLTWTDVESQASQPCAAGGRAAEVYHSAPTRLIATGQQFSRFDPRRRLNIQSANGCLTIPTNYQGFPWHSNDFDILVPVGQYSTKDINTTYRCCGLGVATVAINCNRSNEPFRQEQQPFCATVLLRPAASAGASSGPPFVLEMSDPLRISSIGVNGTPVVLQRDITAQFGYSLSSVNREFFKSLRISDRRLQAPVCS